MSTRRRASLAALLPLLAVLLVGGCRAPRTQILVWVWSNLPASGPESLDLLRITVSGGGVTRMPSLIAVNASHGVAGVRVLPGTLLTLYPDDNAAAYEVGITLAPLHDAGGGLTRDLWAYGAYQRVTSFVPGRSVRVDVYLTAACTSIACRMDETCGLYGCEAIHQPATPFDGSFPVTPDAQPFDATRGDATGIDAEAGARDVATGDVCDESSMCGASCVDLQTDRANCGACGTACPTGSACTGGACGAVGTCPGVCTPGQAGGACGNCGTLTCDANCQWVCAGGGRCSPGDTGASCGGCSLGTQTCNASCGWRCVGGGACTAGAIGAACGNCLLGRMTCSGSCAWGCVGGGACAVAATQACSVNVVCRCGALSGFQSCPGTRTCGGSCSYGSCVRTGAACGACRC
ncbi:MAG: hypothetical protein WCJ30_05250 [Deltaproteobacteria bacterium]